MVLKQTFIVGVAVWSTAALALGCAQNCPDIKCPTAEPAPVTEPAGNEALDSPKPPLAYTKKLEGIDDMAQAVERVTSALSAQGFGVVTDMDVQAIMKKKLGTEMGPYRILGVCNPKLAHQAIEREKTMGLLLPCKVVVYQTEDGSFTVSFARPKTVFTLIDDPRLAALADQVDELIRAAYDAL
jgi:uncharacterized protein (DUF302 family)